MLVIFSKGLFECAFRAYKRQMRICAMFRIIMLIEILSFSQQFRGHFEITNGPFKQGGGQEKMRTLELWNGPNIFAQIQTNVFSQKGGVSSICWLV